MSMSGSGEYGSHGIVGILSLLLSCSVIYTYALTTLRVGVIGVVCPYLGHFDTTGEENGIEMEMEMEKEDRILS